MNSLIIIDLETTGLSAHDNRIIEIGLLRVEDGQVTERYQQLINPECSISPFIQRHTGITPTMVADAPTFAEIFPTVEPLLANGIFVAHNAGFDYSFVCAEYRRLGQAYAAPRLCTAKLSRRLFPMYRRHSLDSLIQRFGFDCPARHRALDDAEVVWQFYRMVTRSVALELLLTF